MTGLKRLAVVDFAVAAALAAVVVVSRLPFVGHILYHWDSINLALALDRFDVAADRPQFPGYLLYVVLVRLIQSILPDPQSAMVAISIAGSAIAVVSLFLFSSVLWNRRVGFFAALMLASSPLFWFYGEIALPHCLDAAWIVVSVGCLALACSGRPGWLLLGAMIVAIAGGFRPQTQLFLMPLAFYAAWQHRWRTAALTAVVALLIDLAWLLPLLRLSGGLSGYLELMRNYNATYTQMTSVFSAGLPGLMRNAIKLAMYTAYGWAAGAVPFVVCLAYRPWRTRSAFDRKTIVLLTTWVLPALLYYLLLHMGQQGLIFVFLPALCLLSSLALEGCSPHWRNRIVGAVVCIGTALFLVAPTFPFGTDRAKLLTAQTLREHDRQWLSRLDAVHANFKPRSAALVSSARRFAEYYFPEYRVVDYRLGARWDADENQPRLRHETTETMTALGLSAGDDGFAFLVILDDDLLPFNRAPQRVEWIRTPKAPPLAFMRFTSSERLQLGAEGFSFVPTVQPAAPRPIPESEP
ncbi:MAG: hypothetical protein HY270_12750 [Deltaproteobacteria bacterium]|nr:hypothetical protein [Deltaproteobacteria bacterium]